MKSRPSGRKNGERERRRRRVAEPGSRWRAKRSRSGSLAGPLPRLDRSTLGSTSLHLSSLLVGKIKKKSRRIVRRNGESEREREARHLAFKRCFHSQSTCFFSSLSSLEYIFFTSNQSKVDQDTRSLLVERARRDEIRGKGKGDGTSVDARATDSTISFRLFETSAWAPLSSRTIHLKILDELENLCYCVGCSTRTEEGGKERGNYVVLVCSLFAWSSLPGIYVHLALLSPWELGLYSQSLSNFPSLQRLFYKH